MIKGNMNSLIACRAASLILGLTIHRASNSLYRVLNYFKVLKGRCVY
jgi:hypothetical protein